MSATEIIKDQMEQAREELANANQQIGVILECVELQHKILTSRAMTISGITYDESQYKMLLDLNMHIQNACRRA